MKRYRVKVFTFQDGWSIRLHSVSAEYAKLAAIEFAKIYGPENVEVHEYDAANI